MTFLWPAMLILLLLLPLAAVRYRRVAQQRQKLVARYGSLATLQAGGQALGRRQHVPPVLFLAGLALLIIAIARPHTLVSLPRVEGTVMLAFDVSGSMAATDMEPTRMEAAKAAARSFVESQPDTVRIGVVAFSDSGLAVQVPTRDRAEILAAIERLAPERGTSLGQGIIAALETLAAQDERGPLLYSGLTPTPENTPVPVAPGSEPSTVIVLLTDGENNIAPNPLLAAQAAADRGVRIFPIGIGSTTGANLTVEGFTVHTSLDETGLRQIADMTEGAYYSAVNPEELRSVYDSLDLKFVVRPETTEITALVSMAGFLVLLAGALLSLLWFGRIA